MPDGGDGEASILAFAEMIPPPSCINTAHSLTSAIGFCSPGWWLGCR
jgi:hypothetical protein